MVWRKVLRLCAGMAERDRAHENKPDVGPGRGGRVKSLSCDARSYMMYYSVAEVNGRRPRKRARLMAWEARRC
jgi:hypothetical protein